MKILFIPFMATVLLLTGCAGVGSEFECNATTSDSCMTMEEANEKAKSMTDTSKAAPAAGVSQGQGSAGNLPRVAPLSDSVVPLMAGSAGTAARLAQDELMVITPLNESSSLVTASVDATGTNPFITPTAARIDNTTRPLTTLSSCTVAACPEKPAEENITTHRLSDGIARLWVAPYVDSDDVLHQPGYIQFVINPSRWQQIQSVAQ